MEKDYKKNRRRPQDALSSFEFGKVPPQAVDLEQAVLGALIGNCLIVEREFLR